jgi:ornithine cyclodeaminase
MHVVRKADIETALAEVDVAAAIAEGFVAYSDGRTVVPPVGELRFDAPPGDVHIKYGYVRGGETYVVKIASGFYENPLIGLPSSNGLMLVFAQQTGELRAVLLDEGLLTDVRTAAAGAVAAKHLAPPDVRAIGIVGTGIQARLQLLHLRPIIPTREVFVFGRNPDNVARYITDMSAEGFVVRAATIAELCRETDLIVTTTPSTHALILPEHVHPGLHLTAVGADTPGKRELGMLHLADRVVVDSLIQCRERGELASADVDPTRIVELGRVIAGAAGRTNAAELTVCDLTGVAVQDVQIATAVCQRLGL